MDDKVTHFKDYILEKKERFDVAYDIFYFYNYIFKELIINLVDDINNNVLLKNRGWESESYFGDWSTYPLYYLSKPSWYIEKIDDYLIYICLEAYRQSSGAKFEVYFALRTGNKKIQKHPIFDEIRSMFNDEIGVGRSTKESIWVKFPEKNYRYWHEKSFLMKLLDEIERKEIISYFSENLIGMCNLVKKREKMLNELMA
jgi:hypothetical protein